MEENTDAQMLSTISEHGAQIKALQDSCVSFSEYAPRLIELERTVDVIGERTHRYEEAMNEMGKDFKLIESKIDTLKERSPSRDEWAEMKKNIQGLMGKSGRSFDKLKDAAITVIITVILTYVFTTYILPKETQQPYTQSTGAIR